MFKEKRKKKIERKCIPDTLFLPELEFDKCLGATED